MKLPFYDKIMSCIFFIPPVSVNVDNNERYSSRYCKRVYNNGTVTVNVDSNGSDLSRYCQRLH